MSKQRVMVQDTAADADALSGTDLEFAPGPGLLQIYMASTVNTATVTSVLGGASILRAQVVPLKANGIPLIDEDLPLMEEVVVGGEKIVVNLGGTTGTVHTLAVFTPLEDL